MTDTTGIAWTDGTVNFWIGCTKVGPGCDGCYAEVFANDRFNIKFGPGEHRHKTQSGYEEPLRWQRAHEKQALSGDRGPAMMKRNHQIVPVPVWVFANSLSDFFDNEIDPSWRTEAWSVIRRCSLLQWQIVTKRVGNVPKMLPGDWHDGHNYRNVGIVATMVNQDEYDRDAPKLAALYNLGVRWTGISMEPRLGPIKMNMPTDWVIDGGESTQGDHDARPFDLHESYAIQLQCAEAGIPYFRKQLGDNPVPKRGDKRGYGQGGKNPELWPKDLQVQQMPRIYDGDPDRSQPTLF